MEAPLAGLLPALAEASRTVGSPQIRNRGTIGGNLGTASPAGDALPPLLVAAREVELASVRGTRVVPLDDFLVGPKRNALAEDELIVVGLPSRPAAADVHEGRPAQRDGDRRRLARRRASDGELRAAFGSAAPMPRLVTRAARRRRVVARARRRGGEPDRRRARDAPPTAATRCACWRSGRWTGASHEDRADRQRRAARGGRLGGREPALRAARGARAARLQERVRAGRVRVVLGAARRHARLRLPRARGAGRRARGRHRRGARARTASCTGCRRRSSRPARCSAASARRGSSSRPRTCSRQPGAERRRDPRGALGQPLPLHRATRRSSTRCGWRPDGRRATTAATPARDGSRRAPLRSAGARRAIPKVDRRVRLLERPRSPPGCSGAHTVRSPHAHARIVALDICARRSTSPGVHAVLTHEDVPGQKRYGLEFPDQPVLAFDRVRYFGEPVAIVAAEHPEQARRAAERIRVEYEPLEPVVDMERAIEQDRSTPSAGRTGTATSTTRARTSSANSSSATATRTRAATCPSPASTSSGSRTRRSSARSRASRSPTARAASTSTSPPSGCTSTATRSRPASASSRSSVRIHLAGVGGAFGGREDLSMQIHGALLALHTSRPVKMVYNREESFVGHVHRHPAKIWAEHRADRDGKLVCVRMRILLDGGAYASTLDRGHVERGGVRVRALRRRERAARVDVRLHEQPALRRDARLRRRPDVLRRRGADGQARRRARASIRSSCGCGTRSRRATCCRPGSGSTGRCPSPR